MFKPEDFQLSMEKELKLRVVNDDIMKCKDVDTLQNSLKAVTVQLMKYQQLLDVVLREKLETELKQFMELAEIEKDKM